MPDRRKLIVVSNRGPVGYDRDSSGERVAKRGGGGLVTDLRSLVSHHDVTWIASAIGAEDRVVAAEAGRRALDETGNDGSPYPPRPPPPAPHPHHTGSNTRPKPLLWVP